METPNGARRVEVRVSLTPLAHLQLKCASAARQRSVNDIVVEAINQWIRADAATLTEADLPPDLASDLDRETEE